VPIAPDHPDVVARKPLQVVRDAVAVGQVNAWQKAALAPMQLCVIRQRLGECRLGDSFLKQGADAVVQATQELLLLSRAHHPLQAPPVVGGVVIAGQDHGRDRGPGRSALGVLAVTITSTTTSSIPA